MKKAIKENQPSGNGFNRHKTSDKYVLDAYERYVMAQFRFNTYDKAEEDRQNAINSLIPGSVHFYHLYFLDLAKKKKSFDNFTKDEQELYNNF